MSSQLLWPTSAQNCPAELGASMRESSVPHLPQEVTLSLMGHRPFILPTLIQTEELHRAWKEHKI